MPKPSTQRPKSVSSDLHPDSLGLADRHVVVLGAGGALGLAVVRRFAELGAVCHLPLRAKDSPEALNALGFEQVHVESGVDPAHPDELAGFFAGLPGLWAMVNCIGGFAAGGIADVTLEDVRRLFEGNFFTALACTQASVRRLRRDGAGGRIVHVAARAGLEPRTAAGMAPYAASKAALAALCEALGEELAAEGILVGAVAPSIMDTPANRAAMPNADHARWPRTEEVADAIVWLASPANALVRSAVVPVYGRS
jgi:NAD(P)-dependent dehydrogenase (short-subunit alcohol dehydrogenase family)